MIRTFHVQSLGCRVSGYEAEEYTRFLLGRGLTLAPLGEADLRIVHTCSVTQAAAADSGRLARKAVRLPILSGDHPRQELNASRADADASGGGRRPVVVVSGCWATSDTAAAAAIDGVSDVWTHHADWRPRLHQLLSRHGHGGVVGLTVVGQQAEGNDGSPARVAASRQRAYLKVQDGCDAHCTYCIIPRLRPELRSTEVDQAVAEAKKRVDEGHAEIVLTGIFLGAYGQATSLHRRQAGAGDPWRVPPLGRLVEALCTRVAGLRRLRLSSLEPADLTPGLLGVLSAYEQVMPHFHLPLQSGSDRILRRMNRQYTRDDFMRMADRVRVAFDRPAITTDIIAGFPGEADEDFAQTMEVARYAGFLDVHAFAYSPRPQTAAFRWTDRMVPERVRTDRVAELTAWARGRRGEFIRSFIGESVGVVIERPRPGVGSVAAHGRCERYFEVSVALGVECVPVRTGELVSVVIGGEADGVATGHFSGRPALASAGGTL